MNSNNVGYYEILNYFIPKYVNSKGNLRIDFDKEIIVKVKDLPKSSTVKLDIFCDGENCENPFLKISKGDYEKCVKEDGKYYCQKCALKLVLDDKIKNIIVNNGSFEDWCNANEFQYILNLWDYELNSYFPCNITYKTGKKFYFKCSRNLHESELKSISSFTSGELGAIRCNKCNSISQWIVDNLGNEYLKYIDWDKNKEFNISPWSINYGSNTYKIWMKCENKLYHESYSIYPLKFTCGHRCPYCSGKKVHELDSLGILYLQVVSIWSDKNNKKSIEYAPMSHQLVWWKCKDSIHKDYLRSIDASNTSDFRCPECNYTKGENRILQYLLNNKINYISQKRFKNLLGLKKGKLSYDFYLPDYNLLIEYQGEQHEKYIKGFHRSYKDFEKQLEHDKRKKNMQKIII